MVRRSWLSLVFVAVLVVASGCGGKAAPSPSPSIASGVEGRVLSAGGPVSPDYPPSPRPYPLSVVSAIDSSGRVIASAQPDQDGGFRLALAPGTYTLKARPTSGNPWFGPRKVSVRAGQVVHVDMVTHVP